MVFGRKRNRAQATIPAQAKEAQAQRGAVAQLPKNFIKIEPVAAVAAGATARWKLPIGFTYDDLYFAKDANCTDAEIEGVRLILNGETVRDYATGTDLNKENMSWGLADNSTRHTWLQFPMSRPHATLASDAEVTSLATGVGDPDKDPNVIRSAFVEADIAAAAAGAAVTLYARVSQKRAPGHILKTRKRSVTAAGSGWLDVTDLGFTFGDWVQTISIYHSNVTEFILKLDNKDYWQNTVQGQLDLINDGKGADQSGVLCIDPTFLGQGNQAIPTAKVKDFRLKMNFSGGETVTEYVHSIGPIAQRV